METKTVSPRKLPPHLPPCPSCKGSRKDRGPDRDAGEGWWATTCPHCQQETKARILPDLCLEEQWEGPVEVITVAEALRRGEALKGEQP